MSAVMVFFSWPLLPSSVPAFLLFLSLPSPSCRSHPQPDGLLTKMESQAQTPSLQNLRIPKRRGGWAPACTSTEQHLQQQRERQWQRAYPRRQTALKTQEKETTETEARSPLATAYACTVSRRSNPGKIWIPTNQIRVLSPRAHVSREIPARALQASRGI